MQKLLTAALLAVTAFSSASPALADITPAVAQEHNNLVAALAARGISLHLDAAICKSNPIDGLYHGASRSLVICNGGSTEMTENNLDTLRHEAVHFMQDCRDGVVDGNLTTVLKPGQARAMLASSGQDPTWIERVYTSHGKEAHVPYEEEAFGIAAVVSPGTIISALNIFCPVD